MKLLLLGASSALAMLVNGAAQADSWPGFFRGMVAQSVAVDPRPGFYRSALPGRISSLGFPESPSDKSVDLETSPGLFPKAAQKPEHRRPSGGKREETEASVELTHTAEVSSALAAGGRSGFPGALRLSAGYYDILQDDDTAASVSLEYHAGRALWWLDPFAGLMVTTEGAAYAYAGLALDIVIADRIGITPSAAIGAYHDGGGKDLGHWVEFRTGGELSYIFNNGHRLGAAFYHISNAGLGKHNPGTEILEVSYRAPLGSLFSK